MPESPANLHRIQRTLLVLSAELRQLDRRLAAVVDHLELDSGEALPAALYEGTHAVRGDLLSDAVETLIGLAQETEEGARCRQLEVDHCFDQLVACG